VVLVSSWYPIISIFGVQCTSSFDKVNNLGGCKTTFENAITATGQWHATFQGQGQIIYESHRKMKIIFDEVGHIMKVLIRISLKKLQSNNEQTRKLKINVQASQN